jgi:hypothetical protein
MKTHLAIPLCLAAVILTGCESLTPRKAITVGGSAAAGGLIGHSISDSDGAVAAGSAVGALGGLAINHYMKKAGAEKQREAYERGYREATVSHMNELWENNLNPDDPKDVLSGGTIETSGTYEGVGYLTRPIQTNPYELYDPAR